MKREFIHPDPIIQEVITIMEEVDDIEKRLIHADAHNRLSSDRVAKHARRLIEMKEQLGKEREKLEAREAELEQREILLAKQLKQQATKSAFQVKTRRREYNA